MKKFSLLFIGVLSMSNIMAQDISDAVRYSLDEVQGTARFRGMSGAFGALGGDMSAVSINPAGSAVFNSSHASISLSSLNINNDVSFFNGFNSSSESKIDLNQTGAAFVFNNNNENSNWKKFVLSVAYDKTASYEDNWFASGVNTRSIDSYFLGYAQGLRLDEISAFPGETYTEAYSEIGSAFGYSNQQAFLGYESYILEPLNDSDENTMYSSNIASGTFNQRYNYVATGYNGKFGFNVASQYKDNLYIGLNLNSHFINYERSTVFNESNANTGSMVSNVRFDNYLSTIGTGFSFQLGAIAKITSELRLGLAYDSPIWYTISEETSQYLSTIRDGADTVVINPNIVNVFPDYKLQTPGKITGSLAYVFGEQGLISFDYSRKDFGNMKFRPTSDIYFSSQNNIISDNLKVASTYRVGGEYRYKEFSFRGGYRLEESPYKNEDFYGNLNGFSLGLGYNFGNIKLDLAYDQSDRTVNNQLYSVGLVDAATIDTNNSNITLTLGFSL
ncbi:outer membrane protein transport protein [Subsaxibacter sp. CAU 1640]|uniref:OmpP1/FadL family transporter n=1 Tax=Subsaxibacter sp. CAU 1640 TaxID=2933271 RepID=UPI00200637D0|nr:outer membrane protein transport protein [Subsaxibacter sp. CAU 1640]MCK7591356.1 outer membrane protein transport protein [Subsaxibacter sp. CAU 1640]